MEQQKKHIGFLIRAIEYFLANPEEEFYDDIPKKAVNYLTYQEIKLFEPLLKYREFKKSTLEERIGRLQSFLAKTVTSTVPQNLELLLEQAEKHETDLSSQKQKWNPKQVDRMWMSHYAKTERDFEHEMQSTDVFVDEASEAAVLPLEVGAGQFEQLVNEYKENPEEAVRKVADRIVLEIQPETTQQISIIETLSKEYVNQVVTRSEVPSLINTIELKKALNANNEVGIKDVIVHLSDPTSQERKNVDKLFKTARTSPGVLLKNLIEETGSEEASASFIDALSSRLPFRPIIPIIATPIAVDTVLGLSSVTEQVVGPNALNILGPITATAIPLATLNPIQTYIIPRAVSLSLPTAATKDPTDATAKAFYYLHGYTKSSFNTVAREIGLTPSQTRIFTNYLSTFESAHPDFVAILASQRASLNTDQIERIFNGPGTLYQNYSVQVPVTGIRGLFLRIGQQAFGRVADNYVNRAVRSGLVKAGKTLVKKVVVSAVGKAVTSVLSSLNAIAPGLGQIVAWIGGKLAEWFVSKAIPFIKKYLGWALGGIGGVVGLSLFGAIGGMVGAVGGLALGGAITGAGATATIVAFITAVTGAVFGAILVPTLIVLIGIPLTVVFVLIIINSGAYIVPSSGAIVATGPGCPTGWPVDDPINIIQGPQGTFSHRGYEAIDIDKTTGTLVKATHAGTAIVLDFDGKSFGLNVRITSTCNEKQFQTVYGHLNTVSVSNGEAVSVGQVIGTIDSTGNSTGPHLHYEFRPGWGTDDGPIDINKEPLLMGPPYIPKAVR